ncbi:hypothetical protein NVP1084O_116 [Vibrio phage 1.084.O._10N.261.49.F5]|nr:hypothetical protein NVP1084O_116 [Vibrio phage 1.084.O._10N.261.49.F5]
MREGEIGMIEMSSTPKTGYLQIYNLDVYYKPYESEFGTIHYDDWDLIKFVVEREEDVFTDVATPCLNVLENSLGLSTQVPIFSRYYTNKDYIDILSHYLKHVSFQKTYEFDEIKGLNNLVRKLAKGG